ncbi:hypothetical protein ACFL2C_00470 [Patescibacteria group bacterium]
MAKKKETIDEKKIEAKIEEWAQKLENMDCGEKKSKKQHVCSGAAGTIWFLGFVGAAVYFIQMADSFGSGVIGVIKALVWPAFVVYSLLEFLVV